MMNALSLYLINGVLYALLCCSLTSCKRDQSVGDVQKMPGLNFFYWKDDGSVVKPLGGESLIELSKEMLFEGVDYQKMKEDVLGGSVNEAGIFNANFQTPYPVAFIINDGDVVTISNFYEIPVLSIFSDGTLRGAKFRHNVTR